jgi:DNA-binding winged helix-turn-helix (wHTH) protein/TolB-like protein
MPSEEPARVCEFGPFRYDPAQRLLFRGGEVVALAPKAIDTLHVLIERRGQIVEKAELMRLVWPDCTVEEVGLARNISLLRKALGDDQERFIATIPKRGYRFVAEAAPTEQTVMAQPQQSIAEQPKQTITHPGRARRSRLWLILILTLALAGVGGLIYWQFYHMSRYLPQGDWIVDLAVLPVDCLSPELERAQFCRGFTDVLTGELAKLDGVHVIAPSTVRRYEQFNIPAPMMARMLRLDGTIEGTAQVLGPRLRLSLRLKDVNSGKVIWAENYDRETAELGQAQIDVARAAAGQIRERLFPRTPAHPASR